MENNTIQMVYWLDHPSQLDVPLFRYLSLDTRVDLLVIYCSVPGRDILPQDTEIDRKPGWDFELLDGYSSITIGSSFLDGLRSVLKYCKGNALCIGIVAGTNKSAFLGVIMACLLSKVDLIVRYDSTLNYNTGTPSTRKKLKKYLLPLLLNNIKYLGYTGKWAKEYLEHYGVTERKLFWFPYTIDNQMFANAMKQAVLKRQKLRAELGIHEDAIVFLVVAKFNQREAPLDAIKAFHLLNDPNTSLIVVGDGPQMSLIRQLVSENARSSVHLAGYVCYSNLSTYYATADIFIHPAHNECWGVSVNEAMVCGLPVIAADTVGAAADLVMEGVNGFVYPHGNITLLCDVMRRCVTDKQNLMEMGRRSKKVIDVWGAEATSQRLIDFALDRPGV